MKNLPRPKIEKETSEEQRKAGRYNPGLVLVYKHRRIPIKSGTSDHVKVWTKGNLVYVMSVNYRHGYAGLEEHELTTGFQDWPDDGRRRKTKDHELTSEVFIQHQSEFEGVEDFFDLSDRQQFNYLWQLLDALR